MEQNDSLVPPARADEPKSNPFSRLIGVFVSPGETMESVARRPDWLAPFALIMIVSIATTFFIVPRIDIAAMLEDQMAQADVEMTSRVETQIEKMTGFYRYFFYGMAFVAPPLTLLIISGLLLLGVKVFGGEIRFGQMFSISTYGWLPQTLKSLIITGVLSTRESITIQDLTTGLRSNLGFLADMVEQPVLFALLSSLDVFTIWALVLFTFGIAAASRWSKGRSATLVFGMWAAWITLKLAFAFLGTMMGGPKA